MTRFVVVDDKASKEERRQFGKFACLRAFFKTVNEKNASMRSSSAYLAMDKTLYPYRGSIGIKRYNPRQPATYRLLYCSLCDAAVYNMYYTLPYAGKPS